ncbi:SspB family protein [Novispirillum sp. DQ9]|uniref:SspB family protein n=1 Tax=Novispirillum sp. DQ9 TaxID=3398612 RepID=UPI003C7B7FE3
MSEPIISYEELVERALRGVLREALQLTVRDGLPGEHHFYITFRTDHPGVDIPASLRAVHPTDMTIVLQHQFWNLKVTPDWFEVELSFKGKTERLHIPFDAVTAFADPFAKFGLQFQIDLDAAAEALLDEEEAAETPAAPTPAPGAAGAKVVTLDAFRKK